MLITFKKILVGLINVFSKLIYNFLLLKIIAIFLGPSGIGIYSQFRSFWQLSTTFTNLNSSAFIVQRLSIIENKKIFFSNSFILILFLNIIFFIILITNIDFFANLIFLNNNEFYKKILFYSSFIIPLTSMIVYLFSSLNGFKLFYKHTILSLVISSIYIFLTIYFSYYGADFDIFSVLKIILISEILSLILLLLILFKYFYFKHLFILKIKEFLINQRNFVKNSSVFLISGLVFLSSILIIKIIIINYLGYSKLGIFESAWAICIVLSFIATKSLSFYYLPELSNLKTKDISIVVNQYLLTSPVIICVLYIPLFLLNENLITIVFSNEFTEAHYFFRWLLFAEIIKLYIYIFNYPIIAKNYFKFFLIMEIVFPILFLFLSFISINYFLNIEYLCIAYLLTNLFYLLINFYFVKFKLKYNFERNLKMLLIYTFFITIFFIFINWDQKMHYFFNLLYIFLFLISYLLLVKKNI